MNKARPRKNSEIDKAALIFYKCCLYLNHLTKKFSYGTVEGSRKFLNFQTNKRRLSIYSLTLITNSCLQLVWTMEQLERGILVFQQEKKIVSHHTWMKLPIWIGIEQFLIFCLVVVRMAISMPKISEPLNQCLTFKLQIRYARLRGYLIDNIKWVLCVHHIVVHHN